MEFWFSENYEQNKAKLSIKVERQLFSGASKYQRIDIFDTEGFGKVLILDGLVMFTESTEFVYHEMITHTPLFVHPNPQNVLVIGGGDGGTVREVVKHSCVKHVDLVEIDEMVVDKCREFFPFLTSEFKNKKVNVLIEDGIKFIKTKKNFYDVIIIDSSEPVGPGEGLFTTEFYKDCKKAMTKDGILTAQTDTPFYSPELVKKLYSKYESLFKNVRIFLGSVPVYPSGLWSFCFCSDKLDPIKDFDSGRVKRAKFVKSLKYYNEEVHRAAFAMPNFVKELVEE